MLVFLALALVLACLPLGADAQSPCPDETFAIYLEDGTLVSCEAHVGAPEACLEEDAVGGYLEDGTLAGCYSSSVSTEEVCFPTGEDADEDGLDDGCDPCPDLNDCDSDGFSDGLEAYVGTDPTDACPDDVEDDAWPPDINNDAEVDILDVLLFKGRLDAQVGDLQYNRRFDINADGSVDILDVLLYKPFINTFCGDSVQSLDGTPTPVVGLGWWHGFRIPVNSQHLHLHAQFRWTIHFDWPIPDLVDVKYSMDFGVEMVWVDYFNASGVNHSYCFVNYEYPYELVGPWIEHEPAYPGPTGWRLECETRVWVFPSLVTMGYPAKVWIDWQIPGYYGGGASGFHKWWLHVL